MLRTTRLNLGGDIKHFDEDYKDEKKYDSYK